MHWTIHPYQYFSQLATQWDQLNQQSIKQPILDSQFIGHCLKHFASGDEIIAYCQDERGPLAIGVFEKIGFGRYRTLQPSQAPLGLWMVRDNKLSTSLLNSLCKALPGFVAMIDILQQDASFIPHQATPRLITCDYITTGRLDVMSDYDDFFASLGKNMRQNYNKVINRCKKNDMPLQALLVTQSHQMEEAIKHFGEFESSGWKGETGTAVNLANTQGQFYLDLLQDYAERDSAEVWYYSVDETIVAADLCIKSGDTIVILKTAYNEQFKKLSPALQLKFEIFRHHANQPQPNRLSNIEFFGKAMEWHKRFNSQLRPIKHFSYFSHGLFLAAYRLLKR